HDTDGLQRALNAGLRARDVSHSRIKRDGLEQGTPAPSFTLPDLDGTERTLEEFLDKRLLLVFSDPTCGPCQALSPQLEALHSRHRDDLNVVMVSRGGIEENDAKAAEHGLTFPVLVQRSWEVSKQYASFGTPVAYLIEPDGVIARDAAQGSDEILKLVAERRRKRAPRSRRRAKAR